MTHPTVIKLHDGNLMPQLGLGVWKAGNEEVVSAIHKALEVGYRSFDTAAAYQNETGVGNALHSAGVNRDELFITTKLWNDDQKRPHEALKETIELIPNVFPSIISTIIKVYPFEVLFFNCSLVTCKELAKRENFFVISNLLQESKTLNAL